MAAWNRRRGMNYLPFPGYPTIIEGVVPYPVLGESLDLLRGPIAHWNPRKNIHLTPSIRQRLSVVAVEACTGFGSACHVGEPIVGSRALKRRWPMRRNTVSRIMPVAALFLGVLFLSMATATPAAHGQFGGVLIDTEGVLRVRWFDQTGALHQERLMQARASLDREIARASHLRKISLNRLEAAIATRLDADGQPTDAMRHLAGLTRVQYVFFYPDTNDIVIAGPAEGWVKDPAGRVVGIHSSRPMISLEDLVVALRTFAPGKQSDLQISCSIDPTQDGLAAMQDVQRTTSVRGPQDVPVIATKMRDALGLQTVSINGIAADTHFAQVLVEADYRMKLISIGLERPPVKMATIIGKARPGGAGAGTLQRLYFVPDYECVSVSEDGLAMEMVGQGVKLVGALEAVGNDGSRRSTQKTNRAAQAYCQAFTKKYAKIAAKSPVYAQLRNLMDLSIAAAHIQAQEYHSMANWKMEIFGDESRFPVETYATPTQVETVVNVVRKGNSFITPIGGGVEIRPALALDENNLVADPKGKTAKAHAELDLTKIDANTWWWD